MKQIKFPIYNKIKIGDTDEYFYKIDDNLNETELRIERSCDIIKYGIAVRKLERLSMIHSIYNHGLKKEFDDAIDVIIMNLKKSKEKENRR